MATQFDGYGFELLRSHIQNNWEFIGVIDDTGTELLRRQVPDDADTTWDSQASSNPLRAKLTVTGEDIQNAGHTLPVTLASTESFESASSTDRTTHDSITNIDVEVPGDEVIITHEFRLPQ